MAEFKTIHIFGFGNVQLIAAENSGTVKSADLTKLTSLVNNIKTLKPADVASSDYHVIHLFSGSTVKYLGKSEDRSDNSFTVNISDLDQSILTEFIVELEAKSIQSNAENAAAKAARLAAEA